MYKIIVRSIFYQWFILFIGMSIGFIANSEWAGYKYVLLERSIRNIFFPIEYNEQMEKFVIEMGQMRTWIDLGCPKKLDFFEEKVIGEEFYHARYECVDRNGKQHSGIAFHRIKWKTWEYYYKIDEPNGPAAIKN